MFLPSNITLKFGDSGDFVSELQRRLAAVNMYSGDQINGFFDGMTVNAVSSFQTRSGLRADGIAGPETLRRLNATLTGTAESDSGGGGGTTNQDDAQNQEAADVARTFSMMDNQQPLSPPPVEPLLQQAQTPAWEQPAPMNNPTPAQFGQMPQQPLQAMNEQQQIQQQLMREAQQHQQQFAQNHDQVAQTLMQQGQRPPQLPQQQPMNDAHLQQQMQVAQAPQHAPQPQHMPQPQHAQPVQQTPQHTAPQQQPPQPAMHPQAAPMQAAAHAVPAATSAAEPARGLIGRAMDKVDAMVQKLANYFESKLSPDTLHEVKQIGQTMMQSGVREVAIPGGADQVRAPSTPQRAPEPMHIPQRG